MIRNVVFDIGGVLVGFDWPSYIKKYGFEPEKAEAISRALIYGPVWKELDRGVWTMDQLLEGFASLAPQYREDVLKVFLNSGACIYRQEYAIHWIKSLQSRGFHTYFLSNYSQWMIEETKQALDFLPVLEGGIFSCDVRQIKPDADIYRTLMEHYPQITPEESVFLDDSPANVETAKSLGFHGIVFQSYEQAHEELETLLHS